MGTLADGMAQLPAIKQIVAKHGPPPWPMHGDASSPAPCPRCQGQGLVVRAHPNPLASVPLYKAAPCPDCHQAEPTADRDARLWERSGISAERRERCTFAAFDLTDKPPAIALAYDAARDWAAGAGPPFLVLTGTTGLGKTHLAIAAARGCINRGEPVLLLTVPAWLDSLRATFQPRKRWEEADAGETSLERLRGKAETYPAVIWDDLGANKPTEWAEEQLYTVADARWSQHRRLLVTMNVGPEALEPRTASRLFDRSLARVVICDGTDHRTGWE